MRAGFFTTVAAAALFTAGAAYASDNKVFIDQVGDSNDATIVQEGNNNSVGNTTETRNTPQGARTARHIATQDGSDNDLSVNQTGNNNAFGSQTGTGFSSDADGFGLGVDQIGNGNYADVDQLSNDNKIARVQQIDGNSLTMTQTGAIDGRGRTSNVVTTVYQENTGGSGNTATIFQNRTDLSNSAGGANGFNRIGENQTNATRVGGGIYQVGSENDVNVVQDGPGQNVLTEVAQTGFGNMADIDQLGQNNFIGTVTQDNVAIGNTATLFLDGDDNGRGSFSGDAAGVGLNVGDVNQDGDDNSLSYEATGNGNLFAFNQVGDNNAITGIVTGSNNQVAVSQTTSGNNTVFNQNGSGNNLGVTQN